ncbi:MAG: tetratricopeptide repeat protein [Acidobacteriaceae bacterium]|nr:tetratricopeptide repeat protein [Acidobacteriaceae bacterium]
MSYPYFIPARSICLIGLTLLLRPALAQTNASGVPEPAHPGSQAAVQQAASSKADAYYHFALGHLYEEMAGTYGNRNDYVNKAIDNFRLAMKEDPSASFLVEDIAELYRVSGRLRDAVEEAQGALKANPNDLNARRVLAHIYTQQIGDSQTKSVDEGMVRKAVEQYKIIAEKDPKDVESLVMLGRLDRVLDNSVDAEASFRKALAVEPDNEDAITGLASIYSDRGDVKTASGLLEQLVKKNPSPRALINLANDYESMREYSLAADAYKKALEIDPNRLELKQALAQDEAMAGRYDDALKTYQEMAQANPQDGAPYLGMAQIYRDQKKLDLARQALEKAKQLDPENIEIQYDEVQLLQDEGRTSEAIASLKQILDKTARREYDPQQKQLRVRMLEQLGDLYRTNQQYDLAVDTFRQIAAVDPELAPRVSAQVVDTYRLGKDYTKAQQESDAALAKYPNDNTVHEIRASLLADQGKTDAAIAELKKLLGGKNDLEVYLAMADVYQKAREYSQMASTLDAAEKLATSKEDKTQILFLRGAMYEREKNYELAEKTFRQVIDADPANASALNYLGYMLADQNIRLQEAHDLIKKAVSLQPNNYAFLDSLGWVYFRLDRLDDAEQQLSRSLQLWPKDPTIHDHLGDVYFKEGKIREAIAQWQSSLAEWHTSAPADVEPDEVAKVQKKLDGARVRLAREQGPNRAN